MSDQNASGRLPDGTFPPGGDDPEFPWPGSPFPGGPPSPGRPDPGPVPPIRVGLDPQGGWQDTLYERLLEQRLAAGLSQTEVAARMGTSQSAVARLESGASDARASTLERYAAAVGGEINWSLNE